MSKTLYTCVNKPDGFHFSRAPLELIREVAGLPTANDGGMLITLDALADFARDHGPLLSAPPELKPGVARARRLSLAQRRAAYCHMLLSLEIFRRGYSYTHGDAYRDPRVFGHVGQRKGYGSSVSLHKMRLAKDYNLWRMSGGKARYLTTTDAHAPFGLFWLALGEHFNWPLEWGGSAGRHDGNHYSYGWEGRW